MAVTIRNIEARDESRWRELWDGYCRFYEWDPPADITNHLWQRIMDPTKAVYAVVAVNDLDVVTGFANYVLHDNTWTVTPVCYLEDLFVDPGERAQGTGGALIEWLVAEMKRQNWSRLYWSTRENNYRARGLYDKFVPQSGFLKYSISNDVVSPRRRKSD